MHLEAEDSQHPEKKVQELEEGFKDLADQAHMYEQTDFQLIAEIGQGICLAGNQKYRVKIKLADWEVITDMPKEHRPGYNRWS